jgi:hypothetical protein
VESDSCCEWDDRIDVAGSRVVLVGILDNPRITYILRHDVTRNDLYL